MSPWRRSAIHVGVGVCGVACVGADGELACRVLPDVPVENKAEPFARALSELLDGVGIGNASVRVTLAPAVAPGWLERAPLGVASLGELQAFAEANCTAVFGDGPWRVAGDWNARHPFLCVACPAWVDTGLRSVLGARVTMEAALSRACTDKRWGFGADGWSCVTFPGSTALLHASCGRLTALRIVPSLPAVELPTRLEQAALELRRESLRAQLPPGDAVRWLSLDGRGPAGTDAVAGGLRFLQMSAFKPWDLGGAACADAIAAALVCAGH